MQETYIPQHLDVPERYIVFTADEALVVIAALTPLALMVNFLAGLVAALAALAALRKFKAGGPLSRVIWRAYWLLPAGIILVKATPASHLRFLAG